jgi:hypothetical protein
MSSPKQGTSEGTGLAFSLARQIAMMLIKRSIQRRLRVIVEQEVQAAVLRHIEAMQGASQPGFTQIVIGEVYNLAERYEGVLRIGDVLHLEEGALSLESVAVDDPHHTALVRRAQARLGAASASAAERDPALVVADPAGGDPDPELARPAGSEAVPTFDTQQRLSPQAAEKYRERLQRIAREDQIR